MPTVFGIPTVPDVSTDGRTTNSAKCTSTSQHRTRNATNSSTSRCILLTVCHPCTSGKAN